MSSIFKSPNLEVRGLWSTAQQNMPWNIFSFMIKYLNNTLPTRNNLHKLSLVDSPSCSFYLYPSYIVDGIYTWRYNTVLLILAG